MLTQETYTQAVAIVAGTPFRKTAAIYAGTAGNATLTINDTAVTFALTAGYHKLAVTNVSASGLTAGGLIALYN
jgi:hypothetical protein